jgi:thiol-disulfide isomerase/thioredoxin
MEIITEIKSLTSFGDILKNNPGIVIVKFGATWCGPCKLIAKRVHELMHTIMNVYKEKVVCYDIDVDDCFELYAFLKSKKMVNGIPAILVWDIGNLTFIPNDSAIGSNVNEINLLFDRCSNKISLLK